MRGGNTSCRIHPFLLLLSPECNEAIECWNQVALLQVTHARNQVHRSWRPCNGQPIRGYRQQHLSARESSSAALRVSMFLFQPSTTFQQPVKRSTRTAMLLSMQPIDPTHLASCHRHQRLPTFIMRSNRKPTSIKIP